MIFSKRIIILCKGISILIPLCAFNTSLPPPTQPRQNICESYIRQYEQQHNIPHNLLKAISLIESGRKLPGQGVVAWPWTICAGGIPFVFDTKEEAIQKVKSLQAQGSTNIDVGCMQINLKHHPDAFASLEDAFDPEKNIAYAAQFLKQKMTAKGNWIEAVAHYHSATPTFNIPYKEKVLKSWEKMDNTSPTQAIFEMNKTNALPKFAHTHFAGIHGRRIPVNVRFSPYARKQALAHRVKQQANRPQIISLRNRNTSTGLRSFSKTSASLYQRRYALPQTSSLPGAASGGTQAKAPSSAQAMNNTQVLGHPHNINNKKFFPLSPRKGK